MQQPGASLEWGFESVRWTYCTRVGLTCDYADNFVGLSSVLAGKSDFFAGFAEAQFFTWDSQSLPRGKIMRHVFRIWVHPAIEMPRWLGDRMDMRFQK